MIVNLSLLNSLPGVGYDEVVDVSIAGDQYEIVGTCTISRNTAGELIGRIESNKVLNGNLYFYYTFSPYKEGVPWFTGLQLNVKERRDSHTTQLKEMIIG